MFPIDHIRHYLRNPKSTHDVFMGWFTMFGGLVLFLLVLMSALASIGRPR